MEAAEHGKEEVAGVVVKSYGQELVEREERRGRQVRQGEAMERA